MAKDSIGNEMKAGDKLFFNGFIYDIKEINENRVIGGRTLTGKNVSGIKIPDTITIEITLPFEAEKPFNGFIVKTPPEMMEDGKPN
jgi:hypothetical protein